MQQSSSNGFHRQRANREGNGAGFTFQELAEASPPQPAVAEDFNPIIGPVGSTANLVVLPPTDGSVTVTDLPLVSLVGANQAYARINKGSISLNHHDANWGYIHFAVIYPQVNASGGGGGSTAYYQVPSESRAEYVAVKQLNKAVVDRYLKEKEAKENPYNEIALMQELGDNIHVLKCIEALQDETYLYIIMPKACHQGTLKDMIPWFSRSETMEPSHVRKIYRQLLNILLYLEAHGICHRDLSPDNFLFLTPQRLVVFDLALSLRVPHYTDNLTGQRQRSLLLPSGRFGTFAYMCPEVFLDRVYDSVSSDLWSVTVILYNMLTSQFLHDMPHPTDISFKYFILAKGLSSNPMNELAVEVLTEYFKPGADVPHPQQQRGFVQCAMANMNIDEAAMELLENVLVVNPSSRWTLAQTMASNYVNQQDD